MLVGTKGRRYVPRRMHQVAPSVLLTGIAFLRGAPDWLVVMASAVMPSTVYSMGSGLNAVEGIFSRFVCTLQGLDRIRSRKASLCVSLPVRRLCYPEAVVCCGLVGWLVGCSPPRSWLGPDFYTARGDGVMDYSIGPRSLDPRSDVPPIWIMTKSSVPQRHGLALRSLACLGFGPSGLCTSYGGATVQRASRTGALLSDKAARWSSSRRHHRTRR